MNCESCPYVNTDACKVVYFNGIQACTAFFDCKGWTTSNHTTMNNMLGAQSRTSANTPENCMNILGVNG